jgi:MraZ protein
MPMLKLTGQYDYVIDGKNRLFITTKLRSLIDAEIFGSEFLLAMSPNNVLGLYPEKCFERLVAAAVAKITVPDEAVDFQRMMYALACPVEFDNQGRLLINEKLRKRANLGNQVTVVGVKDHIEIWNTADWEHHEADKWPDFEKQIVNAWHELLVKDSQQTEIIQDNPEE